MNLHIQIIMTVPDNSVLYMGTHNLSRQTNRGVVGMQNLSKRTKMVETIFLDKQTAEMSNSRSDAVT